MASYAYNPQPFTGMNMTPFSDAVSQLGNFSHGFFNDDTNMSIQYLIDKMRPTNSNAELFRRFGPNLMNQWKAQTAESYSNGMSTPPTSTRFLDYLSNYNFNRDFARLDPRARRENASYFQRPTRVINFTG